MATNLKGVFAPITTITNVTIEQVVGLLVGLMENGCSSWWRGVDHHIFPAGLCYDDFKKGGKMQGEEYFHPFQLIPVTGGCSSVWMIEDPESDEEDTKEFVVGIQQLRKGLEVMAVKYPRHFRDLVDENDDANTADIFGQCIVYGEEVFS